MPLPLHSQLFVQSIFSSNASSDGGGSEAGSPSGTSGGGGGGGGGGDSGGGKKLAQWAPAPRLSQGHVFNMLAISKRVKGKVRV